MAQNNRNRRKLPHTGAESGHSARQRHRIYEREIYRGRPLFVTPKNGVVQVLRDAGPRAVQDFLKHLPALALMHLKKEFRGKRSKE